MIQQSQLLSKAMFLESDHQYFLSSSLVEEQPKILITPPSSNDPDFFAPVFSKKSTKKSTSKDSPKPRRKRNVDDLNENQKFGHWSLGENKRYHLFLQIHNQHFLNKYMRRTDKIFKSMSVFVGSREAEQCRSHHQKMEKKHHNICNILISLRKQHFGSISQDQVIENLVENEVGIIDAILTAQFLETSLQNSGQTGSKKNGEKTSEEESNYQKKQELSAQQQKQPSMAGEQKQDEIRLLPVSMHCFDKDIVELLLEEEAYDNCLII